MLFIESLTKGKAYDLEFHTTKVLGLLIFCWIINANSFSQSVPSLSLVKKVEYTPVKNQAHSGTCWSFSTTSLIESQTKRNGLGEFDLSEMFTVRNVYTEKARNYILRQGKAQFSAGGLGHDVIRSISTFGALPENVYSGLLLGEKNHDHRKMDMLLKTYLDSILTLRPIPDQWMKGFQSLLDDELGKVPESFLYKEKTYNPISFAKDVLHFNPDDYIDITSYTHHPFYTTFILEAPDNFSNGSYYNVPLDEMIRITQDAIGAGHSVMWDADVSNRGFRQKDGFALQLEEQAEIPKEIHADIEEMKFDQQVRQRLYENLTTQDDHLMHLVGLEKSAGGKNFF